MDTLPFTGLDAGFLVVAGVVFVALGVWVHKLVGHVKRPGE